MSRLEILALVSAAVTLTILILGCLVRRARTGAAHAELTMTTERSFD